MLVETSRAPGAPPTYEAVMAEVSPRDAVAGRSRAPTSFVSSPPPSPTLSNTRSARSSTLTGSSRNESTKKSLRSQTPLASPPPPLVVSPPSLKSTFANMLVTLFTALKAHHDAKVQRKRERRAARWERWQARRERWQARRQGNISIGGGGGGCCGRKRARKLAALAEGAAIIEAHVVEARRERRGGCCGQRRTERLAGNFSGGLVNEDVSYGYGRRQGRGCCGGRRQALY